MPQSNSPKFVKYFSRIILFTAIIALVLIYFFNLNTLVSFGDEDSKIKKEIKELEKQNQNLISQIAGQDVLLNIQEKAVALKMEEVREAKYMEVREEVVVMAKSNN